MEYTKEKLEELAKTFPPVGHPHYVPIEERLGLDKPKEENTEMPSAAATKYQELRNKIAEARKVMEETAKGLFTEMASELFKDNPTLVSFGWTQYTPYFNDGDPCVFRCNGSYPTVSMTVDGDLMGYDSNRGELLINGEEAESAEELVRQFKGIGVDTFSRNGKQFAYDKATNTVTVDGKKVPSYDEYHKVFKPLEKIVGSFLDTFEDEDMEIMFGDHIAVTVSRDGKINTEEHEHD